MSEDENTQTVVDTSQPVAQPTGADAGARGDGDLDLDALLAQYDDEPAQQQVHTPQRPNGGSDDEIAALRQELATLRGEVVGSRVNADVKAAAAAVRGDLNADQFDDDFMVAFLDGQARKDPRFAVAFAQREANPQAYQRVLKAMGKTFATKYSPKVDHNATEDVNAVAAAVRGASQPASSQGSKNYGAMTDGELRNEAEKYGISW